MQRPIKTPLGFGSAMRDARKRLRFTQVDLARSAGVTQTTVSNLERGEGNPRLSTVLALCAALGLDLYTVALGPGAGTFPWSDPGAGTPSPVADDRD